MKRIQIFIIILILSIIAFGNDNDTCKIEPKPMEVWDILKWKNITDSKISNDGKWFSWRVGQLEEDGKVFVKSLTNDSLYEFESGFGRSGQLEFSSDNSFLAFTIFSSKSEQDKMKDQKKSLKKKIGIVSLKDGKCKEFENVKNFSLPQEYSNWIGIHFDIPETRKDKEIWSGSDLVLFNMVDSSTFNFGNVAEYKFDKYGKWLSIVIDAENSNSNCVLLRNMKTGEINSIVSGDADFSKLSWTKEGDGLCFLKVVDNKDYEEKIVSVVGLSELDKKNYKKIVFDPKENKSFPKGMSISPNYAPRWKEELDGFFFGIHENELTEEAKAKLDSTEKDSEVKDKEEDEIPNMVIWHWKDKKLQSQQWLTEKSDKDYSYLSYFNVNDQKFYQLASDTIRHYVPSKRGSFSIGYNREKYNLKESLEGRAFKDVYVFDLQSGKNTLALEQNRWYFGQSPDNKYFLYFEDGHFYTYDMKNSKSINITEKVPVSFIDVEDDHNVLNPPYRPLDWSEDSKYVVLTDGWDIWKISRDSKKFENLTKNGRKNKIRYGNEYKIDPEDEGVDFSDDVYLPMYGEFTKKNGFGRIKKGKSGIEKLFFSDDNYRQLIKAKNADVFAYSKEDLDSYNDIFVTDNTFKKSEKITDTNPQQKDYFWSSGRKIINYVSEYGDSLQGVIYLPANYEEGKSYPTIVYMYEKLSQRANNYLLPRLAGIMNFSYYTSNGYAVFTPDITFKLNDPGVSSTKCILPGVEAAIKTGIVDKENLGIQGHSWGGYQTSFIITQTDIFKAACAGAPLTNMLSMYSSIYWNTGGANMGIFESSQGRFLGGYWDNLDAYTRNSPVYFAQNVKTPLLMLHNDKDGAVDWNQGIEYYNTLRRLSKPIVMLEYKGENHGLRKPENRKDYTIRMKEFFDYYLKDGELPNWWKKGVPYIDLEEHLKDRAKLLLPVECESDSTKDTIKE